MDRNEVINLIKAKKRISDLARTDRQRIQCPFCKSGNTDMQIYHDTNRWRCFSASCGKHGSVIDWVMEEQGVSVKEAVQILAASLGIDTKTKDRRSAILQTASRTFVRELGKRSDVLEYWESRGITSDTLYRYHVGYCNEEILKEITRTRDPADRIDWDTLQGTELVNQYNRPAFTNHTVFPYRHWQTRQIVQMQGRVVGEITDATPRWKGLATKSRLGQRPLNAMFWGEEELLSYWKRPGVTGETYAFICEGIPDALTLRQMDIHALSIIGNQGLRQHAWKLANLDIVYLVLDNDKSSQENLPWELYDLMLDLPKTRLVTVRLPNAPGLDEKGRPKKQDVNDFFRNGAELGDLVQIVQQSQDSTQFLVDTWGTAEDKYEPLLTMICERPEDERETLLERLEQHGLFTRNEMRAFVRMMRFDKTLIKSRYRRSRKPKEDAKESTKKTAKEGR